MRPPAVRGSLAICLALLPACGALFPLEPVTRDAGPATGTDANHAPDVDAHEDLDGAPAPDPDGGRDAGSDCRPAFISAMRDQIGGVCGVDEGGILDALEAADDRTVLLSDCELPISYPWSAGHQLCSCVNVDTGKVGNAVVHACGLEMRLSLFSECLGAACAAAGEVSSSPLEALVYARSDLAAEALVATVPVVGPWSDELVELEGVVDLQQVFVCRPWTETACGSIGIDRLVLLERPGS